VGEIMNCPNCDRLFVKNNIRDVCEVCYQEEEKAFETVNKFIKKRENRTATLTQVVEQTGVPEELIIKFIKKGRLQVVHLPFLGYPCDKCGAIIRTGNICDNCRLNLKKELEKFTEEENRRKERERKITYYSIDENYYRKR
jgi:flagellar operon protein (TIGR03826 family)